MVDTAPAAAAAAAITIAAAAVTGAAAVAAAAVIAAAATAAIATAAGVPMALFPNLNLSFRSPRLRHFGALLSRREVKVKLGLQVGVLENLSSKNARLIGRLPLALVSPVP